jgi:hypothetical protein
MVELDPCLTVFGCVSLLERLTAFQVELLLAVWCESCCELLKKKKKIQTIPAANTPQHKLHVRPHVDVFCFPARGFRGRANRDTLLSICRGLASSDMRKLKHLALDLTLWLYYRQMEA